MKRKLLALAVALLLLGRPLCAFALEETVIAQCAQGLSSDDALWRECNLGDYVADAVRQETGAQIALIPAGLLGSAIVGDGAVTEAELPDSIPQDCAVSVRTLSGPELRQLLEDGVSHWQLTDRETLDPEASAYEGYLQVSGLCFTGDASAPVGERVLSVTVDGVELDLTDETIQLTAAVPEILDPGMSGVTADQSLRDMVRTYLAAQENVELPEGDRVRVIGAHQREIVSVISPWLVGAVAVIFAVNGLLAQRRRQ